MMDGERSEGGGAGDGEPEVEDEFACAGILRGSLTSLHATVERIFGVTFGIGTEDLPHSNNGQIWLKLRGSSASVKAAKLFVKGVVNQEEQHEVSYPGTLHCVFCGARGLFVDSLIRSTSAHIVVGSPGFLLISGLTEPVVRAYSLIADLVARYEGTQSRRPETWERGFESLDSRRAFKTLVEKWEDRHILDLLVLPGSVKEILLDLVKESGLGSSPSPELMDSNAGTRGMAEGAEERLPSFPQEMGEEHLKHQASFGTERSKGQQGDEEPELHLSMGNKEFWLLLKFFTAMGYTEEVVKRVLARTGPKEASQILDLVQQEQDHSDREQAICCVPKAKNQYSAALNLVENRPCETEHREDEGTGEAKVIGNNVEMNVGQEEEEGATGRSRQPKGEDSVELEVKGEEEDFVLGVVKRAAASCGYAEQNVAKVYNMLPDGSTHQLLLKLQEEGSREVDSLSEGPRESDDMILNKVEPKVGQTEDEPRREAELFIPAEKRESDERGQVKVPNIPAPTAEPGLFLWPNKPQQLPMSQYTSQLQQHQPFQTPHQVIQPEVKGPPMPIYSSSLDPPFKSCQSNKQHDRATYWPDPAVSKQSHQTHNNSSNSKLHSSQSLKQAFQAQPPIFTVNDSSSTRARERRAFVSPSSVVVTGEQRFLEGLQTPFELKLTDKPGDPELRTIIIDGSNVAMSHGLGHFFSCRGIALAVQHFWDRGHRHMSALVPQWRQKMDPRIKEQHYLTELQKLGLLSYTPSREVQGKRISSYDDRLILQLAQKTDGVIVTNDNLRDLSDESPVWRDIIKKRLLQYTFVGDLFMVPDDPLGRGGPHLNDFLRSEHGTPDPGNHSFAGLAAALTSSKPPRSQTEVLNFRDRTLVGVQDTSGGGGRGKGRAHRRGWDSEHQQRPHGAAGPGLMLSTDRTPEETAGLREQLSQVFPGQDNMVTLVLQCHPAEKDINVLSDLILEKQKD
ncbi:protein KHNYN isoform X2 [Melanotaenia boesemani]|uniref:protein KHNYN isoform X2 n=1 Tax=Melanotaenia boesemani TaxID=1250792 RepID=UPI001C04F097|nr:protein KHNYN isoform X2 [Melanotaenia boesemani]